MKYTNLAIIVLMVSALGQAQSTMEVDSLDGISMVSEMIFPVDMSFLKRAGSNIYIDTKELEEFEYSNINRLLEGQSGVHLYEEDGYGLRPNISIRGSLAERSSHINLMEDGIPIAPAPYSASAAYYFPNISRMKGVEILKGSGQIKYGPNTVGGSINLLSAPTPYRFKVEADLTMGSYNSQQSMVYVGNKTGNFSYMLQYLHQNSEGFKKLHSGNSTGFTKDDILAKLMYANPIENMPFKAQLKYQYAKEDSHETYLGLSDEDFQKEPFSRYIASDLDEMKNHHQQWVASAEIEPRKNIRLSADAYYNTFKRNWFKTQSIDAGNGNISLGSIFNDLDMYQDEFQVINGSFMGDNEIYIRNNNRAYTSKGVQANADIEFQTSELMHDIHAGLRLHYDDADRFQWDDIYTLAGTTLALEAQGTPGTQSNVVDAAHAFSAYLQYQLQYKNWDLTAGLRHEDITLERTNYGDNLDREGQEYSFRENKNSVWIPGLALQYTLHSNWVGYAGVHKGFSPSGSTPDQQAEESWNYELGVRHQNDLYRWELTGFITDYDHLLGSDLNAMGGAGNNELYNAGAVFIHGIEAMLQGQLNSKEVVQFPFEFTYTYQHSSFKEDYDSSIYGEVKKGDALPYIPQHQLRMQLGVEYQKWKAFLSYRVIGDRRTTVGQGRIPSSEKISGYGLVDASLQYNVLPNWKFYVNLDNVFNTTYAVARSPYGLRPGMPFFVRAGVNVHF